MTTNERELLAIPREEIERTINVLRMSAHPQPSPHADALAEYLALPPHPEPHGEKAEVAAVEICGRCEKPRSIECGDDFVPMMKSPPASAVAEPVALRNTFVFDEELSAKLQQLKSTKQADKGALVRECIELLRKHQERVADPQPPAQATPDRDTSSAVSDAMVDAACDELIERDVLGLICPDDMRAAIVAALASPPAAPAPIESEKGRD